MDVTFARTGARRYGVFVERADHPPLEMDPAPGYDDELPHDLVHFVVEEELGLTRGVFGQLAAGGDAGGFRIVPGQPDAREMARARRKQKKRGSRLTREGMDEGVFSERAASICEYEWRRRSPDPGRRAKAAEEEAYARKVRAELSPEELAALSEPVLERICARLEETSARWASLEVGQSITLPWTPRERSGGRRT